jgi:branched-chain amino acid transport system substrate-binding protein
MIDALFQTKGRESVLGTYDIDENGDTTITDYGVYRVEDGELVFDQTIRASQ